MRTASRGVGLWLTALVAVLAATPPAAAAPRRITGKLSRPGFTVIALAANGKATSVRAIRPAFALRPPATRVTLHLRGADGRYAGPIVVGRNKSGTRAIVGVKAGARLGPIKLGRGYARLASKPRTRSVDATRTARARKGVPIGAGRFGRVRSRPGTGALGDGDLDGIPDVLDIDDDGDLVLDNLDRSPTAARAAQLPSGFRINSNSPFELFQTRNANAAGLTVGQIDEALSRWAYLFIPILPGEQAELDCGAAPGLRYCSRGGTAKAPGCASPSEGPDTPCPVFPDCCDGDGDGFGTLTQAPGLPAPAMFLFHGATTAQIRTGDVLIQRVTSGGAESQFPATLQFVFATVPALVSYSDTAGNSATLAYPVTSSGQPGTRSNGFPVAPGSDGNVVLTLRFWRPQRTPIPPETAQWIDIGGLRYTAEVADVGGACPNGAVSEDDPNLAPVTPSPGVDSGFSDSAPDQPANPANTFAYTLNLTQCLSDRGLTFNPGQTRTLSFMASASGGDSANQIVSFRR